MIDVPAPRHLRGALDRRTCQQLVVLSYDCASSVSPSLQMPQLDPQDSALQGLHPIVKAVQQVMILTVLPPIAQHADSPGILGVAGGHCAALAVGPKILSGIKTE